MGNNHSNQNDYKQLPTQSYINFVVQKNLEIWEKNINEKAISEKNSKKVDKSKKSKQTNYFLKFCCCFGSSLDDENVLFLILIFFFFFNIFFRLNG